MNLGEQYNVNPIIFGSIYVGAIPLFTLSVAWLVRNHKEGKSIVLPVLATGSCFVSSYVYLILVKENIPVWAYAFVTLLLGYGGYSTVQSIKKKIIVAET
jgi:hypothetical protein